MFLNLVKNLLLQFVSCRSESVFFLRFVFGISCQFKVGSRAREGGEAGKGIYRGGVVSEEWGSG